MKATKISIIALLLCILLCLGANTVIAEESQFSDMPDDWSTAALKAAAQNGLLNGYDGKIMPKDNLTRAQMAAIIVRAFGAVELQDITEFTDVTADKWYYNDMAKAVKMQVFKGDGTGLLNPDAFITREQVFAVLSRAFGLGDADIAILDSFHDKADISDWAKGAAASMAANGYVKGSDGNLNPKSNITRAEFAQIMFNLVKTYIDKPGTYTTLPEGNVIVRASNVIIQNVTIKGDLIIGDGASDIALKNVVVNGRTYNRSGKELGISNTGSSGGTSSGGSTGGGSTGGGSTGGGSTGGGSTGGSNGGSSNDNDLDVGDFGDIPGTNPGGGDTGSDGGTQPGNGGGDTQTDPDDENWTKGIYKP